MKRNHVPPNQQNLQSIKLAINYARRWEQRENAKTAKSVPVLWFSGFLVFWFSGFLGFLGFLVFSFSGFLVPLAASFWPGPVFYVLSKSIHLSKFNAVAVIITHHFSKNLESHEISLNKSCHVEQSVN